MGLCTNVTIFCIVTLKVKMHQQTCFDDWRKSCGTSFGAKNWGLTIPVVGVARWKKGAWPAGGLSQCHPQSHILMRAMASISGVGTGIRMSWLFFFNFDATAGEIRLDGTTSRWRPRSRREAQKRIRLEVFFVLEPLHDPASCHHSWENCGDVWRPGLPDFDAALAWIPQHTAGRRLPLRCRRNRGARAPIDYCNSLPMAVTRRTSRRPMMSDPFWVFSFRDARRKRHSWAFPASPPTPLQRRSNSFRWHVLKERNFHFVLLNPLPYTCSPLKIKWNWVQQNFCRAQ